MRTPNDVESRPPIKLNDFARAWADISPQAEATFARVGQSGWYILGQEVLDFETALADYCGVAHVVGCASGLDAIELGLRALDIGPGQKVLTTPLSAFATTLAIIRAGATPVYTDVDDQGQLNLDLTQQLLANDPTIKAMVPVHLYGRSLDLRQLAHLRDTYQLKIVEDAAQAIGAHDRGQPVGSVGQLSALSFYPTKNLGAFGDGGAVLCNDPELAQRCRSLRDYGQTAKYVHSQLGMNSRLDELQAALLHRVMLPKLSQWTERRRSIARQYGAGISHSQISLPNPGEEAVWHLYPLRAPNRDELARHLGGLGVGTAVHYPVIIPDQEALRGIVENQDLPKARELAKTVLSLPIHPYMTEDEVFRVVDAVNSWKAP